MGRWHRQLIAGRWTYSHQTPGDRHSSARSASSVMNADSKIVWASKRGGNRGTVLDIYTMNATGTAVTRLTTSKSGDFEPSYSRDGLRIAFTSLRDGNQEIYTMSANGSGAQRVTTSSAADHQPDW